jgi:hypothetical protein
MGTFIAAMIAFVATVITISVCVTVTKIIQTIKNRKK